MRFIYIYKGINYKIRLCIFIRVGMKSFLMII